ncbi:MAG: hypothetical protein WCY82_02860 [Desulfotomaculaceae bacterium]
MATDLTRGVEDARGGDDLARNEQDYRGESVSRSIFIDQGDNDASVVSQMRNTDNYREATVMHADMLNATGKKLIGSPIVVFPNNIADGSYVPGTLIRIIDGVLIQVTVGTVVIQDGPWKPVRPFVAGDQVFIPISSIDAFVL